MTVCYIQPGAPAPSPPPTRANSYIQPSGLLQQSMPSPASPPPEATPPHDDPHRSTLLNEWRRQHGSDWVRADDLSATVRQMIDARGRAAAIRQKLPQLVNTRLGGFELESEVRGNAARPVRFYRLIQNETA
jgi:hypothetical protein